MKWKIQDGIERERASKANTKFRCLQAAALLKRNMLMLINVSIESRMQDKTKTTDF